MKIYLCTLLSKKNIRYLNILLNSLENLKKVNYINFHLVFVIENKILFQKNLISKIIKSFSYSIINSNKDNIPSSRNLFLKFLKFKNFDYAGFVDDDCFLNCNWLFYMNKFIKSTSCSIIGGPQKHHFKNDFFKKYYDCLEPNRKNKQRVDWVASNNCLFSKKIFYLKNLKFDENFKNYGGSDQLFFKNLSVNNYVIKWNSRSYVVENIQENRENISWFLKRNFRYGYSGNLIDQKIYPKIYIYIIILKIFYQLIYSIILLIFPTKKNLIKSKFFFSRALGRIMGLISYKPKKYI